MTLPSYSTTNVPISDYSLGGGLNTTSGALSLQNNESSNLQNVDFDKFGSVLSRNGYAALNTTAITSSPDIDGLHWFEYDNAGVMSRYAISVAGGKLYKMDDLDGSWDNITGSLTITAGNHCDFENFLNEVYITNNEDAPFKWSGSGNGSEMTVPTNLTAVKFIKQFNNYLFLANVVVDGTRHGSRVYYSNYKDTSTWTATDYIEVALNDGQEITGFRVLGNRLVVYKNRSIYNIFFSGDSDIPFILPDGGKSNSSVGCSCGWTIQDVDNGHVFMSYDGFYFYDGSNSYKISDRINRTFLGMNMAKLNIACSLVQRNKNRYICALPSSAQIENNRVFVWDWANNAWSIYTGMAPSAMATFYVNGYDERPYWGDYSGFVYRGDIGVDDYPLNVQTAINSIYFTNWRFYDDLVNKKGIPQVVIYHQISNSILTFGYSYDFEGDNGGLASADINQYSQTVDLSSSSDVYGTGVYGTATYAGVGGKVVRRDLTGRGRVIRFCFSNNTIGESFQIDGLGVLGYLETNK